MAKQRFLALGCATLAAAIFATTPAIAQTPEPPVAPTRAPAVEDDRRVLRGDRTITGDNFTLRSNETLRGDLTVLGGNIDLEERSRVEGDVNILGGNADIAGAVTGDVRVFGGNVTLRSSANIQGDIVKIGGTVSRDAGAVVGGRESSMGIPRQPGLEATDGGERSVFAREARGPFEWFFGVIAGTIAFLFGAALITVIATGIVAVFPSNVTQAASTVYENALLAGGVGAVTILVAPILAVLMALTLCLIPVALLLLLALAVAILAGWSISARILGERVMIGVNRSGWTRIGQTAAGAVILALLGAVPVVGGLIGFLAAALGLGALILTHAGTQRYPPLTVSTLTPAIGAMPEPPTPPPPDI